jgi:outer membrane protein OmpA-like peptidoglycan-associated protein
MDPMVKATWRILALSALMSAVALPVSAQMVIGGSGQPSVEINWAVLDSLGRQPTLADMLMNDMPVKPMASSTKLPGAPQGITYRPFMPEAAAKAAPEARKPKIIPASVKKDVPVSPAVSDLVRAAQAPMPKAAPVSAKPQIAELPAGPQVSLPEIAKPAPVAKAEPVMAEPPKPAPVPVTAKVEPAPAISAPVPAAAPAPVVKPEPVPAPQVAALPSVPAPQVAALPSVSSKGDTISLMFAGDDAKLPAGAQPELQNLAKRMAKDEGLALQLLAYASGDVAGASKARRLSLSRALEVRKFLMEHGVRSTRIEVRALGNKLEGSGPADRVDAVMVGR